MKPAIALPMKRIESAQTSFSEFALTQSIEQEHLKGLSRIELFSVVAEHWLKCSAHARILLLSSEDQFIRSQARAQQKALTPSQICEVQMPGATNEHSQKTTFLACL